MENSERDGNTRPPDLPLEKSVCRSQEEMGMTEDEMVGWHHEFEEALGVGDGQGSLACCSPWCHKELDTIEPLN